MELLTLTYLAVVKLQLHFPLDKQVKHQSTKITSLMEMTICLQEILRLITSQSENYRLKRQVLLFA